jgi:RNA polymerase sigma factor (sigma-70 family)
MSSDESVTLWINLVKAGDSAAVGKLWERYYERLVRLARQKLHGASRRVADEEDAALSAFDSFCRAAQRGRFPNLADREGLWRLLMQMTARKVVDQRRREMRERRGGGRVVGESAIDASRRAKSDRAIEQIIDAGPTPEEAAAIAEQVRRLLDGLGDAVLQAIAVACMEGYTNQEIARQQECSVRTVERRIQLIRRKWQREDQ